MYREGYFRQYLDQDGWQQEKYPQTDIYNLPVERIKDVSGNDLRISIQGPEGPIHAIVWKVMVGRIPLYLLDTNILDNTAASREITARLYAGDNKVRLAQEILLGIGGMQAIAAMAYKVKVLHMNEGHCAFANLQRLAQTMADNELDLKTALEIMPRTTVFTTHTPVAAGHEEFAVELVKPYLMPFEAKLGISVDEIIIMGATPGGSKTDAPLSMFILALHMSAYCNGVSRLHGAVARRMWSFVWPQRTEEEVPISHVTNGIHIPIVYFPGICLSFRSLFGTRLVSGLP